MILCIRSSGAPGLIRPGCSRVVYNVFVTLVWARCDAEYVAFVTG